LLKVDFCYTWSEITNFKGTPLNIARWLGRKHVLTSLAFTAISAVSIQFSLIPKYITVYPDARWSTAIKKNIKNTVERKVIRTLGATGLRNSLIEDYPCLKDVAICYLSSLEARIQLSSWLPRAILCSSMPGNKEYVVCEKGIILDKNFFNAEYLVGLPTIIVEGNDFEEKRTTPELIDCAVSFANELFDQYEVTWQSKTSIILEDKHNPIVITADHTSINDIDRFTYVQRIFENEQHYKEGMKADIRLKDSLVCAPRK
jgi:hypothetical protein